MRTNTVDFLRGLMVMAAILLVSCAAESGKSGVHPTLYDELGGWQGIQRLNETLILTIARDDRIKHFFSGVDIARFHRQLSDHLCELSDGPCDYRGDTLRVVHAGMEVDNAAFNALVEDLILAMDKEGIEAGTQNRLLKRLAALHAEVVDVPLPASSAAGTDMEQIDSSPDNY